MQRIEKGPEPACMGDLRRALRELHEALAAELEGDALNKRLVKAWNHLKSSEQTEAMREALYAEQYGLCAYCQQSLKPADFQLRGAFTIEHVVPRSVDALAMFDWANLLAVCPGQSGRHLHCDTLRGNTPLDIQPLLVDIEERVRLGRATTDDHGIRLLPLVADDAEWDRQLRDVLGLNNAMLSGNRRAVREALRDELRRLPERRARQFLRARLQEATTTAAGAERPAYARVIAEYCGPRVRRQGR